MTSALQHRFLLITCARQTRGTTSSLQYMGCEFNKHLLSELEFVTGGSTPPNQFGTTQDLTKIKLSATSSFFIMLRAVAIVPAALSERRSGQPHNQRVVYFVTVNHHHNFIVFIKGAVMHKIKLLKQQSNIRVITAVCLSAVDLSNTCARVKCSKEWVACCTAQFTKVLQRSWPHSQCVLAVLQLLSSTSLNCASPGDAVCSSNGKGVMSSQLPSTYIYTRHCVSLCDVDASIDGTRVVSAITRVRNGSASNQ
eukprot:8164-Heterococcus_DN1.PRE.26